MFSPAALASFTFLFSSIAAEHIPAGSQPAEPAAAVHLAGQDWTPREIDLSRSLSGYEAAFVLLDPQKGELLQYNPPRCATRFSPCSTFKVPNTLIGLETGVLSGADHLMKWDGVKRERDELNHDHNLRSAIKDSVLWYFQNVATGIGAERMQSWLDRLQYGNHDISGGQTQFWLNSSLQISPLEQAEFMLRLQQGALPFAPRTQELTRELLVVSTDSGVTLRGKTGTWGHSEATLGWFVGTVTQGEKTWAFALNIAAERDASGPKARSLCIEILKSMLSCYTATK